LNADVKDNAYMKSTERRKIEKLGRGGLCNFRKANTDIKATVEIGKFMSKRG
jgi:hypothetical protein